MKPKEFLSKSAMFFLVLFLFGLVSSPYESSAQQGAETYKVDPVHSSIVFKIDHLGVAPFFGRFNNASGTFTIDEEMAENNYAKIGVEVENVDTQNEKRDTHLKSEDFFHAEKYPDIVFETKSFKKVADGKYAVKGELSFHGVTRKIDIEALRTGAGKDPWGGYRMGFETAFSIMRSDFGMDKMIGLVGDEVLLQIAIEGIRR